MKTFTSSDLFFFAKRGNADRVFYVLRLHPELAHVKNVWGHDVLHIVRRTGDQKFIKGLEALLARGKAHPGPKPKKGLPSLSAEDPQSSDHYQPFYEDEDDYPEAEIKAEAELEENMALMSSMFPALSLSAIEDVLKRSKNDIQAGIDFLLAGDAQKPLASEEKRVVSLPLGSEEEFPALASPKAAGKPVQPSYQMPLKENLQQLPQAERPLTPRQKREEGRVKGGRVKGGEGSEQSRGAVPKDEDAEEFASWHSSGGEEEQWVEIEGQEPEGEVLDFEDNVSFAESSGQDWDVVSQSSDYSYQLEPEEEPAVEVRQESGKSNQILDAEVEGGGEIGFLPGSFADALKQNLSSNHVPLRPSNRALLPKSSFVTTPLDQAWSGPAREPEEVDEAITKDPFRPFGRAQKPRKGGKSQYKPKTKGGKGKQSKSYL